MADIRDSSAKLTRAGEHLKDLEARVRAFLESGAYQAVPYFDFERLGIPVVGRVVNQPPVYAWGAIIGDVVHNVRSALDNLVWQLSCHFEGPPTPDPIPRRDKWRTVSFPIALSYSDWRGREGTDLWALPHLHADFKRLQPFCTGPNDPVREPLAVLQELWNRDKHRHVHLTQCYVSLVDALSRSEEAFRAKQRRVTYGLGGFDPSKPNDNIIEDVVREEPGRIRYEVTESIPPGPFEDGAELGLVRPIAESGDWLVGAPHMDVSPILAFDVAFEEGPPAYGGRLTETLQLLLDTATRILVEFEPQFR